MDKRKILIASIISVAIVLVCGIIYAATNTNLAAALGLLPEKNYAIDVIDSGETGDDVPNDDNIEVRTVVLNPDQVMQEMTLETTITNKKELKNRQISIVIDTSYSMDVNAEGYNVKNIAKELVDKIYAEVPNTSMSVVDCSAIRAGMTRLVNTSNVNSMKNAIENASGGYDLSDALTYAKSTLAPDDNTDAYVIVFTDATDNVDFSTFSNSQMEENQKISVYSILTGITSTAFGTPEEPATDGKIYMLDDYVDNDGKQDVADSLNKVMKNVSTTITFNEEILTTATRGRFELEIIDEETEGTAVQNEDGTLTWTVDDKLKAGRTWKLQYKLKLDTRMPLSQEKFYKDIKVIKEIDTTYIPYNKTTESTINAEDVRPVIQLCDAYDLKIEALGEGTTAPVDGAKFRIFGINSEGKTVLDKNGLITDVNGIIDVGLIKYKGEINFTIIPEIENLLGYDPTDPVTVNVYYDYTDDFGGILNVTYDGEIDADKQELYTNGIRHLTIPVYINLQSFVVTLDVYDMNDEEAKLPNVEFRLIQPKLYNKYEMEALYETTNRNGRISFRAAIMSKAGTYDYVLSQMSDKTGYENFGNATIKITFDDSGKVVANGLQVKHNANIEGEIASDSEVILRIKEKCISSNIVAMQVNVTDENDNNQKIEGALYEVQVTKIDSSNTTNETVTYTKTTNEEGRFNIVAIATETGYTKIDIHQIATDNAYILDSVDKQIIINRQNGIVYNIALGGDYAKKNPENSNGIIVNLTNKRKAELNIVKVHVTEKDDRTMNLTNLPVQLIDINDSTNAFTGRTDLEGCATFTLPDPDTIQDGTYHYKVIVDEIPTGYYEPDVLGIIQLNIIGGRIIDITDVTDSGLYKPIYDAHPDINITSTEIQYLGILDYLLTVDESATSYVQIKLEDADSHEAIEYGKYEVTMERNGAQIANAGSTGKYTDNTGYTNKMTIPGLDNNPVTITISQVYDSSRQNGYKVDSNVYTIVVKKEEGTLILVSATLQDGSELPLGTSVTFTGTSNPNIVLFSNQNKLLRPDDIVLDYSVIVYDKVSEEPMQQFDLVVWSDDLSVYNSETGEYEPLTQEHALNPMQTGMNPTNDSPGQINLKMRPTSLPKVEDPNKDGYPTASVILHVGEYDQSTGGAVPGTDCGVRFMFTYSKESGTYKYSGYSTDVGAVMLKDFLHANSENSGEGYVISGKLDLYANVGVSTANFAIDMTKVNSLGQELPEAIYQVKIVSPTGRFITIKQPVINGGDSIEIPNTYVQEGSIITFTEVQAPIGYELDREEAAFIVERMDSTGLVVLKEYGSGNNRITLGSGRIITQNDASKFVQEFRMEDLELNTIKVNVKTKDRETDETTSGNSYKITAHTGASGMTGHTNESGETFTIVGSEREKEYLRYTISQTLSDDTDVARFYKRLDSEINFKVYFDENRNIDVDPLSSTGYDLANAGTPGYKDTWYIESIENSGTKEITIVILQDKQDPLNVIVSTVDSITEQTITGQKLINTVSYEITPTEVFGNIDGKGYQDIKVGFVDPGNVVTYTLKANVKNNYLGIQDQEFRVTYDQTSGDVIDVWVPSSSKNIVATKRDNSKYIDMTVSLAPAVPFVIHNVDLYYNSAQDDLNLRNAIFTVEREDSQYDEDGLNRLTGTSEPTGGEGKTVAYAGGFGKGTSGENKKYIYTVKQNTAAKKTIKDGQGNTIDTQDYARIEDFKIEVEYDSSYKIVGARLYEQTTSTNKFVSEVSCKTVSNGEWGYNGNDRGVVYIEIKNDVAFNINFVNTDRTTDNDESTTITLSGAEYSITSNIPTSGSGSSIAYVDRTIFGRTATYEITETKPANGYQPLAEKIIIEVDFDNNGYVDLNNPNADPIRIIGGNNYARFETLTPDSDHTKAEYKNNFGIKLIVRSTPIFRINIDNIDRKKDNVGITTNIAGAKYNIESTNDITLELEKTTINTVVAEFNKTPLNDYVEYTIHEINPSQDYQSIENDVKLKVYFDVNGIVSTVELDQLNAAYAVANKIDEQNITSTRDYLTVNLTIKSNPLIAININKMDIFGIPLNNAQFTMTAKVKGTDEEIFTQTLTTVDGIAGFKADKALNNKTIVYTLTEDQNPVGYEYMGSDLTIEVAYNEYGKIAKTESGEYRVKMTPVVDWASLSALDDYGFDINIIEEQTKEIGINLNVYDSYDRRKRPQQAKIKAYLATDTSSFGEDQNHSATLISGVDANNDGKPDYGYGQDYKTIGQIIGLDKATLVLKEIETPESYFDTLYMESHDNMYMSWGECYQIESGRIDLTFTDEGKIATANRVDDNRGPTALGICLDEQYLKVSFDERHPYLLNIELYYFPMLEMTINAKSDSSYSRTANEIENDLFATYEIYDRKTYAPGVYISSYYHTRNDNLKAGMIDAGYIGTSDVHGIDPNGWNLGRDSKLFDSATGEFKTNSYGLWPGEKYEVNNEWDRSNNGRERMLYIYEPGGERSEPSGRQRNGQLQYQQHGQQDYSPMYTSYNNHLIASIRIIYNEKGEVSIAEITEAISRNRNENGDESRFINVSINDNKHGITVDIDYKRTTTFEVNAVDRITRTEVTDITLYPGYGGTANTNRRYKYTTIFEQNLARGENIWTYYGGNPVNGVNKYVIGNRFNSAETYNGYDVLDNIELEIHYDEYGFIDADASRVLSTDAAGRLNAEISVQGDKVYLTIILTRKFDMQIDVKDKFDDAKTISDAKFSVTSNKTDKRSSQGLVTTVTDISQGTRAQVGVMYTNETIRYTISQTYAPEKYLPMDDISLDVKLDEMGTITNVKTTDGYILYDRYFPQTVQTYPDDMIKVISTDDPRPGIKPRNINDLRIEVKNYPRIATNVILTDAFYPDEGIPNVIYAIKDATNNVQASGSTTTDENGRIYTYTGVPHPSQTVRYTFNQKVTPTGYYRTDSEDIVDIEYDINGYFLNVTRIRGTNEYEWQKGGRTIILKASNRPKDLRLGIQKDLVGVSFKITREEVGATNGVKEEFDVTTADDGGTLQVVDTFTTRNAPIEYLYTITETHQLPGYRKVPDTKFIVRHKTDGSIDYISPVDVPTNVTVIQARGSLEKVGNGKAHIKLNITNDDKYNLTIINEAKDIDSVRIEGTEYKVEINDELVEQETVTNGAGIISIPGRREMGTIKFKVSEVSAGEGYRSNVLNSAEILIDKGIETYSLTLNQSNFINKGYVASNPVEIFDTVYKDGLEYEITLNTGDNTKLILRIFEDTGNITMTFKNETKSMLHLTKIHSGEEIEYLRGAEFEIKSEEVGSFGVTVEDTEKTIVSSAVTDEDGKITIDLGNRPSNKRIRYRFKELTPPVDYIQMGESSIIFSYDMSGKIVEIESEKPKVISGVVKEGEPVGDNWKDVDVTIKNISENDVLGKYSVKIVMIDSKVGSTTLGRSNTRINDVPFDIKIRDENGAIIETQAKTSSVPNSFGYKENGVILINNLDFVGKVYVEVNQDEVLDGYIKGNNKTTGIVSFENTFVPRTDEPGSEADLTNLRDGGFEDSYIDTNEAQVVIKVFNDPQMTLNLHKEDLDTKESLENVTFTITSEIDGENVAATIPTELNVTTEGTDENGNEKLAIGAPEYGKTVIYTIKENKVPDYNLLNDIKLRVTYNTEGKINDWEILSDETYTNVLDSIVCMGDKTIWGKPTEEQQEEIANWSESHAEDEDYVDPVVKTKGSRQLNLLVKNKQSEKIIPYKIVLKVKDEMNIPVEGVDIDFKLTQGKGGSPAFPVKTTDENGEVVFEANGSDILEMKATILNAQKYSFSSNLNAIYFKNPATGRIDGTFFGDFETGEGDSLGGVDNVNHIIYLAATAKLSENNFNITIMKMDKSSNATITNNPATFTVTKVDEENIQAEIQEGGNESQEGGNEPQEGGNELQQVGDESQQGGEQNLLGEPQEGEPEQGDTQEGESQEGENESQGDEENPQEETTIINGETILGANLETNRSGILSLGKLDMPEKAGTYRYKIYEISAPEGYKSIENAMEFSVDYNYTVAGDLVIVGAEPVEKTNTDFTIINYGNNGIVIGVYDREEVPEQQYMLNIFKIDADTQEKINGSVFKVKLADLNGTTVYTESGEKAEKDGQLDYCYIEQEKDYKVRLKHMTRPTVQEIKNTGGQVLTHKYVFEEVAAPDEYAVDRTPVTLTIQFAIDTDADGNEYVKVDENGTMSDNDNLLQITDIQEDQISANFLNKKQAKEFDITYKITSDVTDNIVDMPSAGKKIAEVPYTIAANIPLRQGYTFSEWNTEPDGSGTSFKPGATYAIDADLVLYAQWNIAEFVIAYDGNAPINEETEVAIGKVDNLPQSQPKSYFDDVVLSTLVPKITTQGTKYRFNSWNTEADGTGRTYYPGDNYEENESVMLYAQWDFAIKYDSNNPLDEDGIIVADLSNFPRLTPQEQQAENQKRGSYICYREYYSVNLYDDPTIADEEPRMEGFKFKEWNTKRDGTGDRYMPGYVYRARKTVILYAIWDYEIEYDVNMPKDTYGFEIEAVAQDMPENETVRVLELYDKDNATTDNLYRSQIQDEQYPTISENLPHLEPASEEAEIDEYIFAGWNTMPDGSGDWYDSGSIYKGNIGIKLYAIWDLDDDIYIRTEEYLIVDEDYTTYEGDKHEYQEGDTYVLGLQARMGEPDPLTEGTFKETFLSNIETNATVKFYKVNGDELADNEYIGTGMKAVFTRGQKTAELILIVTGDCARSTQFDPNNAQIKDGYRYGDGWIDITDTAAVRNMINPNYKGSTKETILATDIGINNGKTDTREAVDIMVIYNNKSYNKMQKGTVVEEKKGVDYYE